MNSAIASEVAVALEPQDPKRSYTDSIQSHLKKNWDYKITNENKLESMVVNLKIDRAGKLFEKKVDKFSEEEKINQEVMK